MKFFKNKIVILGLSAFILLVLKVNAFAGKNSWEDVFQVGKPLPDALLSRHEKPDVRLKGFTLIELIMVIVILGILAATAVPKFIDLKSDALNARRDNLSGALRASVNRNFPYDH